MVGHFEEKSLWAIPACCPMGFHLFFLALEWISHVGASVN